MNAIDQMKFGKFIGVLRKETGLTQKEIAQRIGVSDKAVSKWERGCSLPDIALLDPLSKLYKVSITELLYGERITSPSTLSSDEVEQLVQDSLKISEDERIVEHKKFSVRLRIYILCMSVIIVEGMFMSKLGLKVDSSVLLIEFLMILIGTYFCFFVKCKLPVYYDQNKISFYTNGFLRVNMIGIYFNNNNWPKIVQVETICVSISAAILPIIYLISIFYVNESMMMVLFILGIVSVISILLPLIIVAKKYE